MTPRERVYAVLQHRIPDRVPRFEIWIDALHSELGCPDPVGIYAHLEQDCMMMPIHQPHYSNAWKSGVDEFGRLWKDGVYTGGVVDSLVTLNSYTPPLINAGAFFDPVSIADARVRYPDHCHIWGTHIGPFTAAYLAMGFSTLFSNLFDNPSLVHSVLNVRTDWCIAMYRQAQELGAEVLVLGDDAGSGNGPMISPEMWREFVLPYHRRIVDALDVPIIWHSDGNITSLLPMAVEAGFVGYHGVDAVAGVDLQEIKNAFGRDLIIIGNFDVRILFGDDLNAVHHEVDRCISQGAPGGGYMFSTCNSICEGMNPEAVSEMYRFIAEVGYF